MWSLNSSTWKHTLRGELKKTPLRYVKGRKVRKKQPQPMYLGCGQNFSIICHCLNQHDHQPFEFPNLVLTP
jgi:hypothetical protein